MYQMITGKVPFRGSGFMETVTKQLNEPPPPLKLTKADLDLPDMLEIVMFKCLEKAPENRFQSVADLKSALQTALPDAKKPDRTLSSTGPQRKIAPPPPPPKKVEPRVSKTSKSSNVKGLIVLLVVLVVCAVAVLFVLKNRSPASAPPVVPAPSKVSAPSKALAPSKVSAQQEKSKGRKGLSTAK